MNQYGKNRTGRILKRWQQTITCEDRKIKVVMHSKSRSGNFAGYRATVSDNLDNHLEISHLNILDPSEAQETAYARFVKQFC